MHNALIAALLMVSSIVTVVRADWAVSLTAPRATVNAGEPMLVTVSIKNTGTEPASLPIDLGFEMGNVIVETMGGEHPNYERIVPLIVPEPSLDAAVILPAHSRVIDLELFGRFDKSAPIFPKAGNYSVKVSVQVDPEEADLVHSAPLAVTVTEPAGAVNQQAFATLRKPDICHALMGLKLESSARPMMEDLANGTSIYAPYAALVLARSPGTPSELGKTPEEIAAIQQERRQKVLHWATIADSSGSTLRVYAIELLRQVRLEQGQGTEAAALKARILAEFPNTEVATTLDGVSGS